MPMPPTVGAAVVSYLRDRRPTMSCRRLFQRTLAPHVGFASGRAITMIAKTALERAGIRGYAHQGAHIVARDGIDHPRYLLRLVELELIDRARPVVERRIRFAATKSLDTARYGAIEISLR